jgi:hypothetical protein
MDINSMKREAVRFLTGLETGNLEASDLFAISEHFDPILTFFVIKHLRSTYKPGHPDAVGVSERILELSQTYDSVVKAIKEGEKDPLNEWFDDDFNAAQYQDNPESFIDVLVDKIEG